MPRPAETGRSTSGHVKSSQGKGHGMLPEQPAQGASEHEHTSGKNQFAHDDNKVYRYAYSE